MVVTGWLASCARTAGAATTAAMVMTAARDERNIGYFLQGMTGSLVTKASSCCFSPWSVDPFGDFEWIILNAGDRGASSLRVRRSRNKMQGKLSAAHHPVLDRDAGAVQFGDPLHDRQTEARTALLVAVAPPEPAENQFAFLRRDAGATIPHRHRAVFLDHEFDHRVFRRVPDRVLGEVADRALD